MAYGTLNAGAITPGSGATLTVNEAVTFTGAVSHSDANITNVGDISLDTISSDAGTSIGVTLGTDAGDDFNVGGGKLVVEGDTGQVNIAGTFESGAGATSRITQVQRSSKGEFYYEAFREFSGASADLDASDNYGLFQIVFDDDYAQCYAKITVTGGVNYTSPGTLDYREVAFNNHGGTIAATTYVIATGTRMRSSWTVTSAATNGVRIITDNQAGGSSYMVAHIQVVGYGADADVARGLTLTVL